MATIVAPNPSRNQVDAVGAVSAQSIAREIVEQHLNRLRARRSMELVWEKLLLHIDGTGDFQWADIFENDRVEIPRDVTGFRKTENLLRPVVDNAVAFHTSTPFVFGTEHSPDRRSREKSIIDVTWANHLAAVQSFNTLFAEALYLAMPAGFCPVHAWWREDVDHDWYLAVSAALESATPEEELKQLLKQFRPQQGMIDCFVGNPFSTVFNSSATRDNVRWASYDRPIEANALRETFAHVPGVMGLQGDTRLPSAAEFQVVARRWMIEGLGLHGAGVMDEGGPRGSEEVICTITREIARGADSRWPDGRLQVVAVPGRVDLRTGNVKASRAVLIADQPLPGGTFSWVNVYSHHRGSDIHGKPWVEDMDQAQVDLNIAKSKRWEAIQKMLDAPIIAPGAAIAEDMADIGGYNLLEIDPSASGSGWHPRVMEWPTAPIQALDKEIDEARRYIYTVGGFQAASRGEAPGSRMAYRAIVALQQADNTVHGPVNQRFRKSVQDFIGNPCWRLMKAYADVPWMVQHVGDEHSYLVSAYIDKSSLSDRPPIFKLVNSFGTSPDMRAQEILELVTTQGADGQPFLRTDEARRLYPNPLLFDEAANPGVVQRRRAKTVASKIHELVAQYRQETGFDENAFPIEWRDQALQQAAFHITFGQFTPDGRLVRPGLEQLYKRLRDDDPNASIASLTEITQDETADPLAREVARMRQELYYQWLMAAAGVPGQAQGGAPGGMGARPNAPDTFARRSIAADMGGRGVSGFQGDPRGSGEMDDGQSAASA